MVYSIRPITKDNDFILYILSTKDTKDVLKIIEDLDLSLISQGDGVGSYEDDPFLLMQITNN